MRLDHIAYRVVNRENAIKFLKLSLGYEIDPTLREGFDIQFEDGSLARCYALVPPEPSTERISTTNGFITHAAPEIFVSEGSSNSIVAAWVKENGSGIHHLAYEVDSVHDTMKKWKDDGIGFLTGNLCQCLQVSQLQCLALLGQDFGGFQQLFCGLHFTLSMNYFGAPCTLGLGLLGNGSDHALVEVDMFDFNIADLDAHASVCLSRILWISTFSLSRSASISSSSC